MRRMLVILLTVLPIALLHSTVSPPIHSAELNFDPLPAKSTLVPQNLLKLIHAPEVQQELDLQGDALNKLVEELIAIDKVWWPARILPEEQQRKTVADQEKRLLEFLKGNLSKEKILRLKQIELQSQGTRMFARPDIAKTINLSKTQVSQLEKQFDKTDRLVASNKVAQDQAKLSEIQSAKDAELKMVADVLTDKQKSEFGKLMGSTFDTIKLTRIHPIAPELIDSMKWAGASPVTLAENRGKVVLLHFYAFQCHNCVANFGHYKRWHKTLADQGVQVIGIQTPETPTERDVSAVQKAAKDSGFEFPVLIDVKNENWDAWGNTMWPTVYVIDKQGYIRFWWQGELNWQGANVDKTIEQLVDKLVQEVHNQ